MIMVAVLEFRLSAAKTDAYPGTARDDYFLPSALSLCNNAQMAGNRSRDATLLLHTES
jgi:hypothetical protein